MQTMPPKRLLDYVAYRLVHVVNRLSRPLTLGVRAVVVDDQDRVLLVRHSYVPGWHFPGGGVEPGETARTALARELAEEANIVLEREPALRGVFFNDHATDRDHVLVYVARAFRQTAPTTASLEIRETGFFPWPTLPVGAARACHDRLAEILGGATVSERW
jgi:ADP-ribose pyrophosphatase YjhB (NUDIX family)